MITQRMRTKVRQRETEKETDGRDITLVVLKLAMSLHFPLPKIRTFRFSFAIFGVSLSNDHHCGAEIRNELTLSVAKKIVTLSGDFLKMLTFFLPTFPRYE